MDSDGPVSRGSKYFRSRKKKLEEQERSRRTNRMLIAMVVIFGTSWFPLNLINLLGDLMADVMGRYHRD